MGMTMSSPDDCTEGKMARSASAAAAAYRQTDRDSSHSRAHTSTAQVCKTNRRGVRSGGFVRATDAAGGEK